MKNHLDLLSAETIPNVHIFTKSVNIQSGSNRIEIEGLDGDTALYIVDFAEFEYFSITDENSVDALFDYPSFKGCGLYVCTNSELLEKFKLNNSAFDIHTQHFLLVTNSEVYHFLTCTMPKIIVIPDGRVV